LILLLESDPVGGLQFVDTKLSKWSGELEFSLQLNIATCSYLSFGQGIVVSLSVTAMGRMKNNDALLMNYQITHPPEGQPD